jgi:hypothetical protein
MMKTIINLALGAMVAGILVAPVAWADAQKLVRAGFTVHDVATAPDLWRPAIIVIRSVLLSTP